MLFTRLRQASEDDLTSRIALALAGGVIAALCLWVVFGMQEEPGLASAFTVPAALGLYLVNRSAFSRTPRAAAFLLSWAFAPLGMVCLALAIPIAALVQHGKQGGFTLVEMMVVVGVIAVLALMMIPSYHERFIREQIGEGMPLADVAKKPLAVAWAVAQAFPADNAAAALPPKEKIVSDLVTSVSAEQGAIHITYGNRANNLIRGKVLTLRAAVVEDAPVVPITWICGFAAVPAKMTAKGSNKTDIPKDYLPLKCR